MENAIATITPGHVRYLTYRYGDQLATTSIYCLNLYGSVSIMLAIVLRQYSHCCNHGKKLQHAWNVVCKQRPGLSHVLENIRFYSCASWIASLGEIFRTHALCACVCW